MIKYASQTIYGDKMGQSRAQTRVTGLDGSLSKYKFDQISLPDEFIQLQQHANPCAAID